MLIEPSQAMASLLRAVILQSGVQIRQCIVAKDAVEATAILEERDDIGLVVADCDFLSPHGETPAAELLGNQRLRGVAFLVLSSLVNPEEIESLLAKGAASFIRKPFDAGWLMQELATLAGYPSPLVEREA